ncbi:hypothetical protein ACHBTE_30580 [Streptomyces sp. M41]|uniref:hypothetical protein n=1 Tax=Streptomyces sp. M41 TaxID=3059412 RepID=UPI00374D82E0
MNKEPDRKKKPAARRSQAARSGSGGRRGSALERAESGAAGPPGIRLDLPIQGPTIERRWDLYEPYMQVTGTYEPVDNPGAEGQFLEEPPPKSMFGHVVADPAPSPGRDARGWSCPPAGPCVWTGIV